VSRRARALGFLLAAALAAAAAAAIADSYGASAARPYGELQPVVVATSVLRAGRAIGPTQVAEELEVRRVPARFLPPGALRMPAEALGLVPTAAVAAGAYPLSSQLHPPRRRPAAPILGRGRRPVEIAVGGVGGLLGAGAPPAGAEVDVVVTSEPSGAGPGRTYVAAAAVPLLGLVPGAGGTEAEGGGEATLALTRPQALRLIAAQSFARQVTILPRG
jgi:Flp pilus assembly protein CpaB